MSEAVLSSYRDHALWLTINRPERANALDDDTVRLLLEAVENPGDARAIVFTGSGEKAFCAGADVTGSSPEEAGEGFSALLQAMEDCPVPIIARVRGAAAGGGVGLICASDFAIGSDEATFATPEGRLGVFAFMILPFLLRVTDARTVAKMVFAAEKLSAAEAAATGLLTKVVDSADLDREVWQTLSAICAMGPQAIRAGRRVFRRCVRGEPPTREELLTEFIQLWRGDESVEGRAAFREKRAPSWCIS
ncbi:enoyl-CoA hydratase-related protein [Erythrobacter aureus]|uniref:enoyl-CoA hydratase-related protein n=1 Tax=Erythrobacter aureus TaxID=2182384 RepID=UPI003A92FC40